MCRQPRPLVSQNKGSYHISSSLVFGLKLKKKDKRKFLKFLIRFSKGFFVQIHAFAIMDGSVCILATCLDEDAKEATKEELWRRYFLMYPGNQEPPIGTYNSLGELILDEDGGTERLRNRLGSISRFIQELKQMFSRWYNQTHGREGYLWGSRFASTLVEKGDAQFNCSVYIDLNAVREEHFEKPENFQWSSIGLRAMASGEGAFLTPICIRATMRMWGKKILRNRVPRPGVACSR